MYKLIDMWRIEAITDNLSNFGDRLLHHRYILLERADAYALIKRNYWWNWAYQCMVG